MSRIPAATSAASFRATYFALQGLGVFAWWAWMFTHPRDMFSFLPAGHPTSTLTSFFPADVLFALTSLVASWLAFRRDRREPFLAWFVAGCACYATLWCIGIWAHTGEAIGGVIAMLPCAMASVVCAAWSRRP